MKMDGNNRFFDFVAAMMFLYDVDWDEDLPALIPDEGNSESEPAIAAVAGKRDYANSAAS